MANDSSQDVMCVLCSLNQTISFTAGNHRQNLNSCLARVEMPAVAKGARFGFSVNGDGAPLATATLQLPAEFRAFSCETPTISVRHSVVVSPPRGTQSASDFSMASQEEVASIPFLYGVHEEEDANIPTGLRLSQEEEDAPSVQRCISADPRTIWVPGRGGAARAPPVTIRAAAAAPPRPAKKQPRRTSSRRDWSRPQVHSITKSSFVKDPKVQLPVTLYRLTPLPAAFLVAAPVDGGSDGLVPVAAPLPYAPQASSAAPARGVPVDTTGDGVADSWGWDTTGDGKVDTFRAAKAALDTTGDGVADSWGYDTNGDGRADTVQPMEVASPCHANPEITR